MRFPSESPAGQGRRSGPISVISGRSRTPPGDGMQPGIATQIRARGLGRVDSIRSFIDAVQAFGERLAAVHWGFLVLAAALGITNLALRSRGWQNILRAALPGELIRYRTTFGAYCAGVGVNAVSRPAPAI